MFTISKQPDGTNRDWHAMQTLKLNLQERRRFDPRRPPYALVDPIADSLSDWPDYLAGLISADGSLAILKTGSAFCPGVSITQRADDLPLLTEIQRRTQCGQVYLAQARGGALRAYRPPGDRRQT